MNQELLEKLLDYIDMKFKLFEARDSSDGGLIESIACAELKGELIAIIQNGN